MKQKLLVRAILPSGVAFGLNENDEEAYICNSLVSDHDMELGDIVWAVVEQNQSYTDITPYRVKRVMKVEKKDERIEDLSFDVLDILCEAQGAMSLSTILDQLFEGSGTVNQADISDVKRSLMTLVGEDKIASSTIKNGTRSTIFYAADRADLFPTLPAEIKKPARDLMPAG